MQVKALSLRSFRNLEDCDISFSPGVTLLCGENGQGKTNLLESIYLFSAGRSFRAGRDRDLIRFGEEKAAVTMDYLAGETDRTLHLALFAAGRKKMMSGAAAITKRSDLMGLFTAILFAPEHLELVKAGPLERRKFLDFALSQLRPRYCAALAEMGKVVTQKNALLRDARTSCLLPDTLSIWNEKLAPAAAYIVQCRREYIKSLERSAVRILFDMSGEKEALSLFYSCSADLSEQTGAALAAEYLERLAAAEKRELAAGCCLIGPHRDDMDILINDRPARIFSSQGQQRSAVLALKLAEGELAEECFGEPPVYLFDDIMSELDDRRQSYITNAVRGRQVILTACSGEFREASVVKFRIKEGGVTALS